MLLGYLLVSLWALLISADFDVFLVVKTLPKLDSNHLSWQIVDPNRHECPDPAHTRLFDSKGDVSGNKLGIRCEPTYPPLVHPLGPCLWFDTSTPRDITLFEMHLSEMPKVHYTLYKNGNWEMIGLYGESAGHCAPAPWPAPVDPPNSQCGDYGLWRKFRCYTFYTADYINSYERGWHP